MFDDILLKPARECIFTAIDFETTGSVENLPSEPWQIGMCKISLQDSVTEGYSEYLKIAPDRPFNRYAPGRYAQIRDILAESETIQTMWPDIVPWICNGPVVAHNIGTEKTILRHAAPLHKIGPWIDTLRLSKKYCPGLKSYALEDIVLELGLLDRVNSFCPDLGPHDAYYDAVACGILLLYFLSSPGWENILVGQLVNP